MGEQIALAGIQGVMKMQAARSQARGLAAQATQARLQAKQESLKYKEQGVAVLDNILRTQSAIIARAGAGGIDPFSGDPARLSQYALARGISETYTVQDNELIALRGGEMQAREYVRQARGIMQAGLTSAAFGIAEAQLAPKIGGPTTETG